MDVDDLYGYRDEGCRYFPRCLECPFPKCKEETTTQDKRSKRDEQIRKRIRKGFSRQEVMEEFGISDRTMTRALGGK